MRISPFAAALATATFLLGLTPAASATPPAPENLRVAGGEETWHADNGFRIDFDYPSGLPPGAVTAVRYLVRDGGGAVVVPQQQINWATAVIEDIIVPDNPGIYKAEVWLVDSQGAEGPRAWGSLRFDNARPAELAPLQLPAWLGRAALPYTIRFGYPRNSLPASGIAGYAVLLDSSPEGDPCAAASRCSPAETDLHEGLDGNALAIGGLAEGTAYLHATAVSGSGMKSVLAVNASLRVDLDDPETQLLGAPDGWTNEPVTVTAIASDTRSGMEALPNAPTPFTALRVDEGLPHVSPGPSASATVIAEGVHTVSYYARDAAGNVDDGGTSNGLANAEPSTATVRIDRRPPDVAFASAESPGAPEVIHVQVEDSLSGAAPSRGWIGVRTAGSGDRFQELNAEPMPTGFRARWDSEAYPPGQYEFRAIGYDAAGNTASTMRRANGSSMVLSNPVKAVSVLQAGFEGAGPTAERCAKGVGRCRRRRTRGFAGRQLERVVPFGDGARFGGRLTTASGAPLSGVEISVIERFGDGPAPAERLSTVRTGADGTFVVRLVPGASREVTAIFDGTPSLTRATVGPTRLAVRSGVSLHTSSAVARVGGAPLIFEGTVAAERDQIPPGGKSVQLQFRLPGLPWTEFRTVQTDARGRFRLAYRFSDDDSRGVRFQFRAYAPAQDDWPYEPAGSRPVVVRGA